MSRYEPMPDTFFASNRDDLAKLLPAGSVVILHSNDVMPTNADGSMGFHQNANFFYLTGIDQEESVLVMTVGAKGAHKDNLYLKETSELIAIWDGEKLTKEQAVARSGVKQVHWTSLYDEHLEKIIKKAKCIYLESNLHPRSSSQTQTRNVRLGDELKAKFKGVQYKEIYEIIAGLRTLKKPVEIEYLKQACKITGKGFKKLLKFIKPGVGEWEVEGKLHHEFVKLKSRKFSFSPIIAGGKNACVLHYITNNDVCKKGDMLLLDIGAEYGYYCGDMTRTVPVSGKFSPRQKEVYEAVLCVMRHAEEILRPGIDKRDYERQIRVFMGAQLVKLGLLKQADLDEKPEDPPAVKKYYMHGCSHFLGLDVHDVGPTDFTVQENMVFTIEPGIYIREEGIGVRLENDYLVHKDGIVNLMPKAPIEIKDIEKLMAK